MCVYVRVPRVPQEAGGSLKPAAAGPGDHAFLHIASPVLLMPKAQIHLSDQNPKPCSPEDDKDPHSNWSPATCLLSAPPMHETHHSKKQGGTLTSGSP